MNIPQTLLAAWAWVNVMGFLWAVSLGWIDPGGRTIGTWVFFFAVAIVASLARPRQ